MEYYGDMSRRGSHIIKKFDNLPSGEPAMQILVTDVLMPPESCGCFSAKHRGILKAPKSTTVVTLGDISYVVTQCAQHPLSLTDSQGLRPLTVLHMPPGPLTVNSVRAVINDYTVSDDVFCSRFLKTVMLITDERWLAKDVRNFFVSQNCKTLFMLSTKYAICRGPYFFSRRGIFRTCRLYPDTHESFTLSTIPWDHDPDTYYPLNASAYGAPALCVAVPSRLYFTPTARQPLAGMRIAVKDALHVNGVGTTCGNRGYAALYGPQTASSAAVREAISKGAIIVGKTKTVEFAAIQDVVGDFSEYSSPLNCRADGGLAITGSSVGSAASVAAYPWLDLTLGMDAGGSVRDPATATGVYGLRPSHDGLPEPDSFIPCPRMQRSGFLGRSMADMTRFARHWLGPALTGDGRTLKPRRVIMIDEFVAPRQDVQAMFEGTVDRLCNWLGVKPTRCSLEQVWKTTNPVGTFETFHEYFKLVFHEIVMSDYWHYTADFRRDYRAKFGVPAYVSRPTRWMWKLGESVTQERMEEALRRVAVHNAWFTENIMPDRDTILVYPRFQLTYRDEYWGPPEAREPPAWLPHYHASFAGLPDLSMPIGQISFMSEITERTEMFPASMSVVAAQGADISMLDMIGDFLESADSGLPSKVLTGRTPFPLKDSNDDAEELNGDNESADSVSD